MPVDRLITIAIAREPEFDGAGILIPDPNPTVLRAWATALDLTVERQLEGGGARGSVTNVFRVRWTSAIASTRIVLMRVWDEYGASYLVTERQEATGRDGRTRRRWLDLETTRDTTAMPIPAPLLEPPIENGNGDMMEMIMAAPTFTELATATVGNADTFFVAYADAGALRDAWNSGDYWAFLVEMTDTGSGSSVFQHTALIPIRVQVPTSGSMSAYFTIGTVSVNDDIYLRLAASAAVDASMQSGNRENIFIGDSTVKIWGVS